MTVPADEPSETDDESLVRWLAISAPLSPVRAAALAAAMEQDGIPVTFLEPDVQDFPTEFGAQPATWQRLAVPEDQHERALGVMARVDAAFPDTQSAEATTRAAADVAHEPEDEEPALVEPVATPRVADAVSAEKRAFEARRVRRYTEGLFIFVIGLVWTIAMLPRIRSDSVMAVVGVVTLCAGLLLIYTALSMREGEDEATEAAEGTVPEEDP